MFQIDTIENIMRLVKKSKGVVCFGSGDFLTKFEEIFSGSNVIDKVLFCVDNDINKQGTAKRIGNRDIKIISFEELKEKNLTNVIIIITCIDDGTVYSQIMEDDKMRKYICIPLYICWSLVEEKKAMLQKVPDNLRRTSEPVIPKVINYCWFGGKDIPDINKKWIESWRNYCPDYEIKEWNEKNYDISKNKYMLQAYEQKKWGFVSDYARLDIIYNYGGIYLDTDVELLQNLDDLLYQDAFVGFENSQNVNLGLGFGSKRGFSMIKKIMECYSDLNFVNKDGSLNTVPCPFYQTKSLQENGLIPNGQYQIIKGLTVYPEKMLCGKNYLTNRVIKMDYTRAIHHFEGSWLSEKEKEKDMKRRNFFHKMVE